MEDQGDQFYSGQITVLVGTINGKSLLTDEPIPPDTKIVYEPRTFIVRDGILVGIE